MNKTFKLLCMASLGLWALNAAADNDCTKAGIIEVVGSGEVESVPDLAVLRFTSSFEAKNTKKVRDEVEKKVTALVKSAKALGITDDEIVSGNFTLYPKYRYSDKGAQIFEGYSASRDVTFRLKDFSLIEKVAQCAVDAGITRINGFSYEIKDTSSLKAQADAKAIADAKDKAQRLASGFDVKIKGACSLRFENSGVPQVRHRNMLMASAMAKNSADGPEVVEYTPEKQTVHSTVYATFSIE